MKAIKNLRRAASLMLALVLLLTMFPVQGTAEEIASPSDLPTAEETVQEEGAEDTATSDAELLPDSTAPPEETSDETPVADAGEETSPAEDAAEDTPNDSVDDSPVESAPDADLPADEQPVSLKDAIAANGFAYVPNLRNTKVYNSPELTEDTHIFTLTRMELVLLATDYLDNGSVEVWFLVSASAAMHGYVSAADLAEYAPTAEELADLTYLVFCKDFTTSVGVKPLYLVYGDFVGGEEPTHGETEPDVPADENAKTQAPAENPSEEQPADENAAQEDAEATEPVTDADAAEALPDDYIDPSELPEPDPVEVGSYVTVTTQTRVFSDVDVTAGYDYIGDLYQGYFVKEATVRVEAAGEDCCGRWWYEVTYLYGDTYANGKLKWTATDRAIVLARETIPTDSAELTVTDYAFPRSGVMMLSMAEEPEGFSLKTISVTLPTFTVGQTGLHGSSGKDSEYKQIATLEGHGKIYATPHYLEGYTVYCLEHTLPGPGENISGGGQQPTGPYLIVDWESYQITDGYSGAIYGEDTMHAIAWVLAHGYPFMVLDRTDSDNETWSRVATQFAIREVIKQLEGSQFVRDYWQMENFYAASNNAPAVYLEYARWLARNGIAHASKTGAITVSNKTMGVTDSGYYGSATLTTDADLMRISRNVGTITGNTAGEDGSYYYLNSGDTITLYTTANSFAITVESVADDEADFLVGVPDVAIQKVLIPIEGVPYPMQEITLDFRIEYGAILVTKTDADSGAKLSGATFALLDTAETILQTATTDGTGTVTFSNIKAGQYQVQEIGAPTGYLLSVPTTQPVTVTAGATSQVVFANDRITSKIRIVKTDALTHQSLAGATFTITDESGALVATLTTGTDGMATSDWLPYGTYIISETVAPDHYVNSGFSQTMYAHENGKTYEFTVENAPTKGGIRLTKTDALDGHPIVGVTFDIYLGKQMVASMTTNESGVAVAPDLEKGSYTIREVALPEGYTGTLVELTAEVQSDQTTELACTNTPIQGKVRIEKKDSLTGATLVGATFSICDANGSIVETLTTGADGSAESGPLRYGEYTITETSAPEHYVNSGFTETFFVSEEGKTYTFQVENAPTLGSLRLVKTDAISGAPLAGVVFDVYQGDFLIGSMTTDEQGVASYADLDKGTYIVRERELPTGYTGELAELTAEVQSDEITELSAVNHPILGRVRIIKKDSLTGEALAGAVFTITDDSDQTIATLTTGEDGMAESDLLRYGTYTLVETTAPENYINPGISETVIISEHEKTYTYEIENVPVQGWLRLSKTDALNGKPIVGVTFDVWQGDNLVTSMTTNTDGVATSDPLYPGSYTVRERELPTGYAGELVVLDAVVTSANTTELTCTNMPSQSKVRIVKTDSLTHEALPGAEFTVTDAAGIIVATLTTGTDGTAETDWLRYGVYTVKETLTPAHYVPSSYMTTIEAFEDGKTYILDVENEPTKGFIEIVKIDEVTRTPIAGVTFDIYQGDKLVSTMTTNTNGAARSEALHKGQYIVREHENPTGYVGVLSEQATVVRSDETTYLTVTNQPIQGRIQIIKTDAQTGEKLAGAVFTITRISGIPAHNGAGDGEVVATITTDAEGMAITPLLTWGTYLVEETTVPAHYVDNAFSVEVSITNELETVTVEVSNEPAKGWLQLTKTDRVNGNPIAGVQFDVYYNDQYGEGLACTMVTDENGIALSEPLRKGQYIIREHGAVDGYVYEEICLEATVKSDEITELAVTNQPVMTRIKLYKRDKDEYDGKNPNSAADEKVSTKLPREVAIEAPETRGDGVLTGAVLRVSAGEDIVDRQGNVIYPMGTVIIESLTTAGENASVETGLLWPGLYEVQEIAAPSGYQLNEEPFYVDTRSAAYQSETAVVSYTGLSLNEVKYGAISIVKILGANSADPDPTRVEPPEEGAKFRVYLKSAGSYDNARKIERDTLTTDEHGYAMTKPLPSGVYVLEQVSGKEGYEIKGPIEFEITGEESLVNPSPITLSDQPILYRLTLIKTDAETGKVITLANTAFKLKDSDGNYVTQTAYYPTQQTLDTFTTDESGTVTLPETVTWGLYYIEEVQAPEGYLIRTESLAVMIGHSGDEPGQTYELDIAIPNEPVMGRIRLEKRGMQLVGFQQAAAGGYNINIPIYEDRYLAGAVFEIRAAEDIVGGDGKVWYRENELVQTITTTDSGADMSMELPLGRYYLLEVKAPEGYILADTPYEVELAYVDDKTPVVEVTVQASNAYLPAEISLAKVKEVMQAVTESDGTTVQSITTAPGEGCVFGLFNASDIRYPGGTLMADSLLATGVTDENGQLTFSGVYPHGDYYIKELSAPDGWKVNPNSYPISLTPDMTAEDAEIIRIALSDPICNEIMHTPVTITKTDVTGAHTVPGALIEVEDSSGSIIYREYTDENGEIPDIPLIPGDYTFREVLAPEGYALNTAEMAFSVDATGNVTGSTTIRDDYTRVTLKKVDLNGEPLEGVGFGLYREGKLLATAYSDADGVVTFTQIPYGDYTIRETRPLAGYMLSDTVVRLTVDGSFVNPDQPLATIENNPIEVILRKVDKDNKPLSGAVFALVDDTGAQVMTALSDETGTVKFTYVPYSRYTIQEIEAPTGYLLSRESIPVVIDKNYQNSTEPLATLVNQAKRLSYIKVDTSGKPLPGVVFDLIRADTGEIVESVTSNEWGEFIFTRFDYGEWIIREAAALEGFNRMEDVYLVVDENWVEPAPITLVNIPNHYAFIKTDHQGNPLAGVKFTLEDAQGNILRDLVSGEDGVVHVTDLAPGDYTIREIETLEGFTRTEETIQVTISEQYIVPDEMFRLVNYPIIQTGVDADLNLWAGAVLAGCSALILICALIRKRKQKYN